MKSLGFFPLRTTQFGLRIKMTQSNKEVGEGYYPAINRKRKKNCTFQNAGLFLFEALPEIKYGAKSENCSKTRRFQQRSFTCLVFYINAMVHTQSGRNAVRTRSPFYTVLTKPPRKNPRVNKFHSRRILINDARWSVTPRLRSL